MKTLMDIEIKNLIRMAIDARARAYAPYSNFPVGACLKGQSGAYYLGCNIENAAFTPGICAERTALSKAISEGEKAFEALCVVNDRDTRVTPCGVCRQTLAEFCAPDMPVICASRRGEYKVYSLGELLPHSFGQEDL